MAVVHAEKLLLNGCGWEIVVAIAFALGVRFEVGILAVVVIIAANVFGIAFRCIGIVLALKTKSVQVTQTRWIMVMPVTFLTSVFMPRELPTGWFKMAVEPNAVKYSGGPDNGAITTATWLYHSVTA